MNLGKLHSSGNAIIAGMFSHGNGEMAVGEKSL